MAFVLWQVIKTCRENRGLSVRELAAKCRVSEPAVRRWESNAHGVTEPVLEKVAVALEITVAKLLSEGLRGKPCKECDGQGTTDDDECSECEQAILKVCGACNGSGKEGDKDGHSRATDKAG